MSQPLIGEVKMFGGNFAPRGWAFCEGQLLAISSNSALFSILGTTYGGDGRTTFGLPDLRGRAAIQQGSGPGLPNYSLGQRGGAETHTLIPGELPPHSHIVQINANSSSGSENSPAGNFIAAHNGAFSEDATAGAKLEGLVTNNTGGNLSHSNIQPFLAVSYIIALVGVYPSRT